MRLSPSIHLNISPCDTTNLAKTDNCYIISADLIIHRSLEFKVIPCNYFDFVNLIRKYRYLIEVETC